ncbi:MAG: hypothetical protein UX91_C0007G0024 [Candidatus Amesbacteria bacterium GW2011_GWB1_47_19]|nr:MAG: hypothetical protein UW51_C0006G0155 [Candidatus Amesbacteria bacterium GW2011_GWA1_44_24]KKU31808.1 MAG: hypothetical protein UX46_C0002G0024 [Candidatus Amesbacteria bacterium GW2011_GWC1_46_24]KKU66744.1 MAG: hypothetical protein UX91_C0007G0024 [Candidatus Amesbacteria bacterium GW2011_GWB1_47_19]OGD05049.1 MAG: hypothetical protein A2379_00555 [Candidatus Amesbacteria bacterium RIFOXYB1_FULL_47_13]HBC73110.1 antitoxin [Candidatus Amesbacteria bacterium]
MRKLLTNPFKNLKLDTEEREINEAIESGRIKRIKNFEQERKRYQKIAKYTLEKIRNINIRLTGRDLQKLKEKATTEGIPYQTLVSSVLHKYANQ